MAFEIPDHFAQQRVAGGVAQFVVDGLQIVHVHEYRYEACTRPPCSLHLALDLLTSAPSSAGAGRPVGSRPPALIRRLFAVLRREGTIARRLFAIVPGPFAVGSRASAP